MKPRVFISYSSSDLAFARRLRDALEQTKAISTWHDNLYIRTGDLLYSKIERAILDETDICLFYLSPNALKSKWVKREHETAIKKKNTVIYYFIDTEETRGKLKSWPTLKGSQTRIPVISDDHFYEPFIEFIATVLSRFHEDRYPNVSVHEVLEASQAKGIQYIQYGGFTRKDDESLWKLITGATRIQLLLSNGSNFFITFKTALLDFFKKDDVRLEILLADEDSEFYNENSVLVHEHFNQNATNKSLVGVAIERSIAIWDETGRKNTLIIKKFNTQFRLPLLIFDDGFVQLTINLPPDESFQGMTLQLVNADTDSYANRCIAHFDAVWKVSVIVFENGRT